MSKQSSLHRVLEILNRLNSGEKLCVSRLLDEYEVSERTIQRDFKIIIEVFDDFLIKDGECYRGYKKVLLDELLQGSDLMMLSNIVNIFDIANNPSLISNHTKQLIKNSNDIYLFKSNPIEKVKNKSTFKILEHAIKFKKESKIIYHGRYIPNQKLTIQPYKIVFYINNFYLLAKNITDNNIRRFRISNIEYIEVTNKVFYKDKEIEYFINSCQTLFADDSSRDVKVKLIIPKVRAKYFFYKQYLPSQKITKQLDNGNIEVEYQLNNIYEVEHLILKWMPEVTILEPLALKELIRERLLEKLESLD